MVRPVRWAAIQSASGTRTPEVVPFQVKTMSLAGSADFQIARSQAQAARQHSHILELEAPW